VARWLRGIQLLEYAPKFVEAGLDDLNFIAQVRVPRLLPHARWLPTPLSLWCGRVGVRVLW